VVDFETSQQEFRQHLTAVGEKNEIEQLPEIVELAEDLQTPNSSTVYDPYCIDCHLTPRIPVEKELELHLHCLRYKA